MRAPLLALSLVIAAIGCTEKSTTKPPEATALLSSVLLKAAPAPQHASELQFGDKIRLLGYDVSTDRASAGKPFKVTWYWHVLEPLESGYQVFTHLSDGRRNRENLDADRALRRIYPEANWRKGDYLRDEQDIELPSDWNADLAVFYLGFYADETRLPVTRGKDDGSRRGEALRLTLTAATAEAAEPVPELKARRTTGTVRVDGKLDEPDWSAAQSTGAFVNTMTGAAGSFDARAQVLYDAEAIYIAFVVADDYLKTRFREADDHLWEEDTVEVMFDPEGDARNYFELQVSPRGVHFDTRYDARRVPRPFGHVEWSSQVQARVTLDGTLDDEQSDRGYTVELKVPWSAFAAGEPPAARPNAGEAWRINFFVMDARERGQRAVGWSAPRIGDFHTLHKFGRVVFPEAPATPQARAHSTGAATRAQ